MGYSIKELAKSKDDRKIIGICGGLGKYTPLPSWLWRAIFIITLFTGGIGIIAYIVLTIFMPKEKESLKTEIVQPSLATNAKVN